MPNMDATLFDSPSAEDAFPRSLPPASFPVDQRLASATSKVPSPSRSLAVNPANDQGAAACGQYSSNTSLSIPSSSSAPLIRRSPIPARLMVESKRPTTQSPSGSPALTNSFSASRASTPKHAYPSASPSGSSTPQIRTPASVSTPPHRAEIFDAIVQAADPRHPDHAAWKERYGSLSKTPSRGSCSSPQKRDRLTSPSQPSSTRRSMDQYDSSERRRHAYRDSRTDRSLFASSEYHGSDADDPLSGAALSDEDVQGRFGTSVEGSMRSYRASSVASSQRRRRNKRNRDKSKPKSLVPPIPPPRVTSSMNWQSTFGSPAIEETSESNVLPANRDVTPLVGPSEAVRGAAEAQVMARSHDHLYKSSPTPSIAHPYASPSFSNMKQDFLHQPPAQATTSLAASSAPTIPKASLASATSAVGRFHGRNDSASAVHQRNASTSTSSHVGFANGSLSHYATASSSAHHSGDSASTHRNLENLKSDDKSFTFPRMRLNSRPSGRAGEASDHPLPDMFAASFSPQAQSQETLSPSASSRKSMTKIRQILGNDAPKPSTSSPDLALPRRSMSKVRQLLGDDALPAMRRSQSHQLTGHKNSISIARVPVPALTPTEEEEIRRSLDATEVLDLNAFPLRQDNEFRGHRNEFEVSDDSEDEARDDIAALPRISSSNFQFDKPIPTRHARSPGVVRRSLDSIISPFRAGLLNNSVARTGTKGQEKQSMQSMALNVPEGSIAAGRRSFSESRFIRPFIPRQRKVTQDRSSHPFNNGSGEPDTESVVGEQGHSTVRVPVSSLVPAHVGYHSGLLPPAELRACPSLSSTVKPKHHDSSERLHRHALGERPGMQGEPASSVSQESTDSSRKTLPRSSKFSRSKPEAPLHSGFAAASTRDQPSQSQDIPSMSVSSSRSLANSFSRSTTHLNGWRDNVGAGSASERPGQATISPAARSSRKFGDLFAKMKSTKASSKIPSTPSSDVIDLNPVSGTGHGLQGTNAPAPPAPSFAGEVGSSNIPESRKLDKLFRNRVKSFASVRGMSSRKEESVSVPALPDLSSSHWSSEYGRGHGQLSRRQRSLEAFDQTPSGVNTVDLPSSATLPSPDYEPSRSIRESSTAIQSSGSFKGADKSPSRTFGKLLRRKKTRENLDVAIQDLMPLPPLPKMSHPDLVEEAAPRPSMSSVRGFDVVSPEDATLPEGQTPSTIRKTLSPALLSETTSISIDAQFGGESNYVGDEHRLADPYDGTEEQGARPIQVDEKEELDDTGTGEHRFRSPLGRFIRSNSAGDRLSRVEESSERFSQGPDTLTADAMLSSTTSPTSPNSKSFGEHRSVRRTSSGNVRRSVAPPALELQGARAYRFGKHSIDIPRGNRHRDMSDEERLRSPAVIRSFSGLSSPGTASKSFFSKSPRANTFGESLTPSWKSTGFSTPRSGRTSFSQDRDRAPVASPISPPLPANRSTLGSAVKLLRGKGRNKGLGKGIGPSDFITMGFDDGEADEIDTSGMRPSMSLESRHSFAGGPRPSFAALARPNVEASGRSSFVAAEMVTKMLEVEAQRLSPSPVTPSFGPGIGIGPTEVIAGDAQNHAPAAASQKAESTSEDNAGLGIGSIEWVEGLSTSQGTKTDGGDTSITTSTSEGTFTSQGAQTPDSHSQTPHLARSLISPNSVHSKNAITPVMTGQHTKTPDLRALEDMLGKFPQQEKELLQDISARALGQKTPVLSAAISSESLQENTHQRHLTTQHQRQNGAASSETGSHSFNSSTASFQKEAGQVV